MEEISWSIYEALTKKKFVISFLVTILFFATGWFLQNKLGVEVCEGKNLFEVIVPSLLTLTALVGVMVIFGFEGIRNKYHGNVEQAKEQIENDILGWQVAKDKFLKFSVYSFAVATINLFLIILPFPEKSQFLLAFLFTDIALTGYSLALIVELTRKTMDVDKKILDELNKKNQLNNNFLTSIK